MNTFSKSLCLASLAYIMATAMALAQTYTKPTITIQNGTAGQVSFSSNLEDYDWGDYDGDGDLDFLMTGHLNEVSGSQNYGTKVYRNDGNNVFYDIRVSMNYAANSMVRWGDFDNDGDLDIIHIGGDITETTYGNAYFMRNDGSNTFTVKSSNIQTVCESSLSITDFNSDGKLDLLYSGRTFSPTTHYSKVYKNLGNFQFEEINAGLRTLILGEVSWVDYNSDGLQDIFLSGLESSTPKAFLYQNTGSGFVELTYTFPELAEPNVSWGDYNKDGFPDLLLVGNTNEAYLLKNDNGNGTFTNEGSFLDFYDIGKHTFADVDSDGDLDIVGTAVPASTTEVRMYVNDGAGNFSITTPTLTNEDNSGYYSKAAWFDYNNDGQVDISWSTNIEFEIWINQGTTVNATPTTPSNLAHVLAGNTLTLSWDAATDTETPANLLEYDVRVGTSSGTQTIVSSGANAGTGTARVTWGNGNAGRKTTLTIPDFTNRGDIFWSVQAIDQTKGRSAFAAEQVLNLPANEAPVIKGQKPLNILPAVSNALTLTLNDFYVTDSDNLYPNDFTFTMQPQAGACTDYAVVDKTVTRTGSSFTPCRLNVQVNDGIVSSASFPVYIGVQSAANPMIIGQTSITTAKDQPLQVLASHLMYDALGTTILSIIAFPGPDHTVAGATVIPVSGFSGTLNVPVFFQSTNGTIFPFSNIFGLTITVVDPAANESPEITGQLPITINEEETASIPLNKLLVIDPDGSYPDGYSVQIQSGTNYTVSGNGTLFTPAANFSGTLPVSIKVSDGIEFSEAFAINITVNNVNEAPVPLETDLILGPLVYEHFTYRLPSVLFADADNDALSYSLSETSGLDISWITFDEATLTISGTPGDNQLNEGFFNLRVTANDGSTDAEFNTLFLWIYDYNDAPIVNFFLDGQFADAGLPFSMTFPGDPILDGETPSLNYTLTKAGGAALPAWLTFNDWTLELSGTPANADAGLITLELTGTDQNGLNATITFQLTVNTTGSPKDITSVAGVSDIAVPFGTAFNSITFPSTIQVTYNDASTENLNVTFAQGTYNGNAAATYTLQGTLTLSSNTTNSSDLKASVNVVVQPQPTKNITSVASLNDITVAFGTAFNSITFPSTVQVTYNDASTENLNVTFAQGTYNGNAAATYTLQGTLTLSSNTTNSSDLKASVNVVVQPQPTKNITSVVSLNDITVAFGTAFNSITFPSTVQVTYNDASTENLNVTFAQGTYNGNAAATYAIGGTLTLASNTTNAQNKKASVNVVVQPQPSKNITSVANLSDVTVAFGTAFNAVAFPATIQVTYNDASTENLVVTFSQGTYNGNVAGTYTIEGTLTLSGNTTNSQNKKASVNVVVQPQPARNITSIASLNDITVVFGTAFIAVAFPTTVQVTYNDASTENLTVTFAQGTYNGSTTGTYNIEGTPTLSPNTTNSSSLKALIKISVSKQNQTLTFDAIADKTIGDTGFSLNAIANSGLTVSYSSTSDKITLSSSNVTIAKAGRVTITASQAGNTNYNAAADVNQSFCIKPAKPTIAASGVDTETPLLTSSSASGNQWYFNGTIMTGATNATLSVTVAGIYTVQVSADDCKSIAADEASFIITGDLTANKSMEMKLYPNPVENELHVSWPFSSNSVLLVYQADGKELERITTVESQSSVNVGQYAKGQYILLVKTNEKIYHGRFIKH